LVKFKPMNTRLKNGIALSLILQVLLVKWLGRYPELIETYYSNGLYRYLSNFFRWVYGSINFSIGDLLYATLIIISLRYLYIHWKDIRQKPFSFIRDIAVVLSIAYFSFHILWGFNYYRLPVYKTMELNETYSTEDLLDLTEQLVQNTNDIHYQISLNDTLQLETPYSQQEIFTKTTAGYHQLKSQFPFLTYENASIKKSMMSTILSYMGYGGYLNPFTQEAQVNRKIPNFRFPVVTGHEIAHQLGYAAENEANFMGYLATVNNEDPYFKYTALAYALSYCLSEVRNLDENHFKELYAKVNRGIQKDYEELNRFWLSYKNPMEPVFKSLFNTFLKVNNQPQGIQSYSLVVSLLVAYHKENPL